MGMKKASIVNHGAGFNALFLSIGKALALLISMVTAMMLSRFRTLEEYGTYSQIIMVVNLSISIFALGLPNTINYFYPRADTQDEKDRFLSTYVILIMLISFCCGLILVLILPLLSDYFNNNAVYSYAPLLAMLPFARAMVDSRSHFFIASEQTHKVLLYSLLNSAALLLIILFTRMLHQTFYFYMILYLAVEVLFAVVTLLEMKRRTHVFAIRIDTRFIKKLLVFSIPLGVASAVGTINRELDKLMIGGFLGTEMLAQYTNAAKEMPFTIIASSFTAILLPKLVKMIRGSQYKEAISLWKDTIELNFIIISMFAMLLFVFAPQFITVLYSEKYLPGVNIYRIYALELIWRVTYFGMILNSTGRTKLILHCSVASLSINVVLNYVLLKLVGFVGPAIATFISIGVVAIYQVKTSADILGVSVKDIFPWKSMAGILAVNIVSGSILFLFTDKVLHLRTETKELLYVGLIVIAYILLYLLISKKRCFYLWKRINAN